MLLYGLIVLLTSSRVVLADPHPSLDPNDFDYLTLYTPPSITTKTTTPGFPDYWSSGSAVIDGKTMTVMPLIGTVWYSAPWTTSALTVKPVAAPLMTSDGATLARHQPDPSRHPDLTFNFVDDIVTDQTITPSTTYWVTTARLYKNATFTGAVRNTPCSTCKTAWKSIDTVNTTPTTTLSTTIIWTSDHLVKTTTIPLTATDWMLVTITTDQARWTAMVEVTKLPWATMTQYQNLQMPPLFENVLPKDDGHGFYKMTQIATRVDWPETTERFPETSIEPIVRGSMTYWPDTRKPRITPINEDLPTPVPRKTFRTMKSSNAARDLPMITAMPASARPVAQVTPQTAM